jgi:hypothetical protein
MPILRLVVPSDPAAGLRQQTCLPQHRMETQQVSLVLGQVFEIFGLSRNAIRQGKLLLAVTLSISGELRRQSGSHER